jgi:phospholipase/carboxylesterase
MTDIKFHEYSEVKNPKHLVIFLHGYGSNGENLLGLAQEFKRVLPEAHFISPNAIEPWEGGFPDCYQWFSLYSGNDRKAIHDIAHNVRNSNKILQSFIHEQLKRFNLKPENLFLVGFSQGAMMSLYQGFNAPEKFAGIVSFSGRLILPETVGEKSLSIPEICLIHGELDSVLPFEHFIEAKKTLESQKISFIAEAIPNLDHSIDIHGIRTAQAFVKKLIS